ncbi:MAG: hypothetical protein KTR20_09585 [Cellvibrionaceae bacterium]|nr:hypothetical protein [Cellvibrionaceae bacterium]
MKPSARLAAENASFDAFMNGYLREIDPGLWLADHACAAGCIELQLTAIKRSLRLTLNYRSVVGRHAFAHVYARDHYDKAQWQMADKLYSLIAVIQNIYKDKAQKHTLSQHVKDKLKIQEAELLARLYDSYQLMTRYLDKHSEDTDAQTPSFLSSEQSLVYGHWLHPTPKSRQGMTFWQQDDYSPELYGRFKLHYFSVDLRLVTQGSTLSQSAAQLIADDIKQTKNLVLADNHVLIPQHPLQAHYLLLNKEVQSLIDDGRLCYFGALGKTFSPTSSVRTLYCESSAWMYKVSMPVKITNSLRANKRDELEDGMAVAKYLHRAGFLNIRPQFKLIDDPAYITVNLPSQPEKESGFELVLRRNFLYKKTADSICSILALVQEPVSIGVPQDSLLTQQIKRLAKKENRCVTAVAEDWFADYFSCAIESLIILYDTHGIALEAHQQNSLLDLSAGYPKVYYYRDNQGFYLSRHYANRLHIIDDSLHMSAMFYDDEKIFEAMAYYIFFNQLFAVIHRMGADQLMTEQQLIAQVQQRLRQLKQQLTGMGRHFIDYMLEQHRIACKTNLLARINDIDELHQGMETAVYAQVPNPLVNRAVTTATTGLQRHAV